MLLVDTNVLVDVLEDGDLAFTGEGSRHGLAPFVLQWS